MSDFNRLRNLLREARRRQIMTLLFSPIVGEHSEQEVSKAVGIQQLEEELQQFDPTKSDDAEEHARRGHLPYSAKCPTCVMASGRDRQHRSGAAADVNRCLSVDLAGPFVKGHDGSVYILVGALHVQRDEIKDVDDNPQFTEAAVVIAALAAAAEEGILPQDILAEDSAEVVERQKQLEEEHTACLQTTLPFVRLLPDKKASTVGRALQSMVAEAKMHSSISRIHSDKGSEFVSQVSVDWVREQGIYCSADWVTEGHKGTGAGDGDLQVPDSDLEGKPRFLGKVCGRHPFSSVQGGSKAKEVLKILISNKQLPLPLSTKTFGQPLACTLTMQKMESTLSPRFLDRRR